MTPQAQIWAEVEALAAPFGVNRAGLAGRRHTRQYTWTRQMAYAYVHRVYGLSKSHIGRMFGGRDHATVFHGIQQHEARMAWVELLRWAGEASEQPDLFAWAA